VSIDLRLALRSRLHGAHLSCLSVICIDDERFGRAICLLFHVTTQACRFFASWILGSLPNFETEDFPLSKSLIRATGRARLKPSQGLTRTVHCSSARNEEPENQESGGREGAVKDLAFNFNSQLTKHDTAHTLRVDHHHPPRCYMYIICIASYLAIQISLKDNK